LAIEMATGSGWLETRRELSLIYIPMDIWTWGLRMGRMTWGRRGPAGDPGGGDPAGDQ
jgi:hypothetical protein